MEEVKSKESTGSCVIRVIFVQKAFFDAGRRAPVFSMMNHA
jgi:hypothetical protein